MTRADCFWIEPFSAIIASDGAAIQKEQ